MREIIIRARRIVLGNGAHIENGYIAIWGSRIKAVGTWHRDAPFSSRKIFDVGHSILLPGLINAHSHLCFTGMVGMFDPSKGFHSWVKAITCEKNKWTPDKFLRSWITGCQMLLKSGVTTTLDVVSVPELFPDILDVTPLRVIPFLEVTGIKSRIAPDESAAQVRQTLLKWQSEGRFVGVSPHSPYATTPQLLRALANATADLEVPAMIHVAESQGEFEMFLHADGPMYQWLARNERDMYDCGGVTPVQHLTKHWPKLQHTILIHANYVTDSDIQTLAANYVPVVHCPRSHKYFNHHPFQWHKFSKAGIPVCLGTDSLASVTPKTGSATPKLDMFEEMRTFADAHPEVPPKQIVMMATGTLCKVFKWAKRLGTITPGAIADLVVVPDHVPTADPHESLLYHIGRVTAVMINGQWVFNPNEPF